MKKIFIIDDDKEAVTVMKLALESKGFETSIQSSLNNIVENVNKFDPDCIILEALFPNNNGIGFQIARELKNNFRTKNKPILMVSAINSRRTYVGRFSNKDRDDTWFPIDLFIDKPVNADELMENINLLIEHKAA